MLPTKRMTEILNNCSDTNTELVLQREAGVITNIRLAPEMLNTSQHYANFELDTEDKQITIKAGKTFLAITDTIGIPNEATVDLFFIDKDTMCVQLVDGVMSLRNAEGLMYSFNTQGTVIKYDPNKVHWVSIKDLYSCAEYLIKRKFNILADTMAKRYIYNMVLRFTMSFEYFNKAAQRDKGSTYDFRYRIINCFTSLACNSFEFKVQEKVEKKVLNTYVAPSATKPVEAMTDEEYKIYQRLKAEKREKAKYGKVVSELDDDEDDDDEEWDDEEEGTGTYAEEDVAEDLDDEEEDFDDDDEDYDELDTSSPTFDDYSDDF